MLESVSNIIVDTWHPLETPVLLLHAVTVVLLGVTVVLLRCYCRVTVVLAWAGMGKARHAGPGGMGELRQSVKVGKLNLVDLAGSERVHITGATGHTPPPSFPPCTPGATPAMHACLLALPCPLQIKPFRTVA